MFIITGTSSGIGKAIATHYLAKGEKVVGLSRTNTIVHDNFMHVPIDFSDLQQVEKLDFRNFFQVENLPITLINNAGIIGNIQRSEKQDLAHYSSMAKVNIVAPQYLTSHILKVFGYENITNIVNISSGAGRRPIASWAAYCASKAAIDLFSETLQAEILELGYTTRVYSLAPGVVDTNMQKEIRSSEKNDFSENEKFIALKNNNELRTPEYVAQLLANFLENPPKIEQGVCLRL